MAADGDGSLADWSPSLNNSEIRSTYYGDWMYRVERCARELLVAVSLGVKGGLCGVKRVVSSRVAGSPEL